MCLLYSNRVKCSTNTYLISISEIDKIYSDIQVKSLHKENLNHWLISACVLENKAKKIHRGSPHKEDKG